MAEFMNPGQSGKDRATLFIARSVPHSAMHLSAEGVRMRRVAPIAYIAGLCIVLALEGRADETTPADPATRVAMQEIFKALTEILPRCLSSERFAAPGDREIVSAEFAKIATNADALAKHAGSGSADFASRGAILADDARRASAGFASGRLVEARFVALRLTESCIGCHSRLPSDKDAPFASKLIDDAKLGSLTPIERARLAVATRQFDKALELYEAELAGPAPSGGVAVRTPDLVEYLIVAVRVKRDPKRAAALLEKLEKRPETSPDIRDEIGPWLATLRSEGQAVDSAPSLAQARSLVESGKRARDYPYSKAGLIDELLASSILHRLLEDPKQQRLARAET
jgi:cytochrome c556